MLTALKAGFAYAEAAEIFTTHYRVRRAAIAPGKYRNITGNEATALGFVAASVLAKRPLFYASYPITPASDILHELSTHKNFGVKTFQAEDEIAAVCAAIGASFAGQPWLTGTSGPGLALKIEAIGLAVMTELPVVIIDVQRGGPSTGLPTKTEQADLASSDVWAETENVRLRSLRRRHPPNASQMAIEAFRIATKHMLPVIYLSDGYLANGAEPWRLPEMDELPSLKSSSRTEPEGFNPTIAILKHWRGPGRYRERPELEHRIGGIEKQDITGNVSYDPENHMHMVLTRAEKVARIANDIPDLEVFGGQDGRLLVVGWGSTYGSITSAVEEMQNAGQIGFEHSPSAPESVPEESRRNTRAIRPRAGA